MKVAVLVGKFPILSETFILNQITGLIDRGHDVTIFAMEKAEHVYHDDIMRYDLLSRTKYPEPVPLGKLRRLARCTGESVNWARVSPMHGLRSIALSLPFDSRGVAHLMTSKMLRGQTFDIMHCHFGFMGKRAAKLAAMRLLDYPFLTSYHGIDLNFGLQPNEYKQLHQLGALFTVNSEFSRKRALELGCPEKRIALLPVGLHPDYFAFAERRLDGDGVLRILSVARLIKAKGIGTAIEAIHLLNTKGLQIRFDIVGDGPLRAELERQSAKLGLQQVVTFHGSLVQQEVRKRFSEAHIFVLPSIPSGDGLEGQGLVLQEAQSMGLPVIASDWAGIPEGLESGKSGYLFPPGDSEALADRIKLLAKNHLQWPEMGRVGRRLVETRYDVDRLNDKLVDLYTEVCADHPRPSSA